MILALDVHYKAGAAKTVGALFHNWEDAEPAEVRYHYLFDVAEYEPGAFYKRELPCLMGLIGELDLETLDMIIVDSYVFLDDDQRKGLGAILFDTLGGKVPVVGVAKTRFNANTLFVVEVCRGNSKNPLFVSSVGIPMQEAAEKVAEMHGNYRMPTLLKLVDFETKKGGFDAQVVAGLLAAELQKLPEHIRYFIDTAGPETGLFRDASVVLGLPSQKSFSTLTSIPEPTTSLYSFLGSEVHRILQYVLLLEIVELLQHLTLGHTDGCKLDYSLLNGLLAGVHFPELKSFAYGSYENSVEKPVQMGYLGDLTPVLPQMPKVEILLLYGAFEITEPLYLPHVMELEVTSFLPEVTGGQAQTSPETILNLLASRMPFVEEIKLELYAAEGETPFLLPLEFLSGESAPRLRRRILSDQFSAETHREIAESSFFKSQVKLFVI